MSNTNNNSHWTPPSIVVQPTDASCLVQAQALVERFSDLALVEPHFEPTQEQWVMQLGNELPQLRRPDGVLWSIDFRSGKAQMRANEPKRAQQPLARALGITKLSEAERAQWHVVDGTAGGGADGWQLAATGAHVTLVEQHPVLFVMLDSAIQKALEHEPTQRIAQRIDVIHNTIEQALVNQDSLIKNPANAVYLDPMYPVRRSKAAVKKPMQFIQALVGRGPEPTLTLQSCLQQLELANLNRVVVKRPSEAAPLIEQEAWHGQLVAVNAGAARFDVYLNPN